MAMPKRPYRVYWTDDHGTHNRAFKDFTDADNLRDWIVGRDGATNVRVVYFDGEKGEVL